MVEVIDYYPFGSVRIDEKYTAYENDYKFTGYELDESGLNYAGARYYDSISGRFTGKDRIVMLIGDSSFDEALKRNGGNSDMSNFLSNPQNLNYYSYVGNNPLKYVDPSGNLRVRDKGATDEQKEAFNEALHGLQEDVKNNQEIQDYYRAFGVDINEALINDGKGVDVYLGRDNNTDFKSKGNYNSFWNDIDIFDNAFSDKENIQHTLMHEMGHWANDVGKWWGNLNPDISKFGAIQTKFNEYEKTIRYFDLWRGIDGDYGFGSEILTFGDIL